MTTALAEQHRRRTTAGQLRKSGIDPFPDFEPHSRSLIADVLHGRRPAGVQNGAHGQLDRHQLAGRIIARRRRGSVTYLKLRDRSGVIRLRVRSHLPPSDSTDAHPWDIGDIVEVFGEPSVAQDGVVGLDVTSGRLLAKALQINHGLSQGGHTAQRPELALMEDRFSRERLIARARLISAIREWMTRNDFLEVETPTLQAHAGGALARPFNTHHNALDREVFLRISSEFYLRRCTVGDVERVFELGRCFRNEGVSTRHSPEFTMLEWSMSYSNYRDSATLVEQLVAHIVALATDTPEIAFRGRTIDLMRPWRRISLRETIAEHAGSDIFDALGEHPAAGDLTTRSWSDAVHRLYATEIEPHLIEPTIVFDFPLDTHPCAKRHPEDGRLAQCFDVVIGGLEIASGGSEISDPDDQRSRFAEREDAAVTELALHPGDRDYVAALEYGAPPSSGGGVGIDRLLMVLFGLDNIADVKLFPSVA